MKTPTMLIILLGLWLPMFSATAQHKSGQVVAYAASMPPAAASIPVPAEAPVAGGQQPALPGWEIRMEDRTVRVALERWAAAAGWQLSWGVKVDYPVEADAVLNGTFEQAVEAVVTSLERSQVPLKAVFYQGNKVLRVAAKGGK